MFVFKTYSQSDSISSLLDQKQLEIQNGSDCILINQALYRLGHVPKAVVEVINEEKISFHYHQPISETRTERIIERLKTYYPYIKDIVIDTQNSIVNVEYNTQATSLMISETVTHFAFDGYENK